MKAFSDFLLTLYCGAEKIPTDEFKDWALNEVKSLILFDSSVWGSGCWINGKPRVHVVHLNNLDESFVAIWMQHQHEDKLARLMPTNIAYTFNVDVSF